MIRPFLDHAIQLSPGPTLSVRFNMRIIFGASAVGGFATLQTLKSPSDAWTANISDFCLVEDACHARLAIGEGARSAGKVCRMVKAGRKATSNIDPLRYLMTSQLSRFPSGAPYAPNGICLAVCCRRNGCNRVVYCSGRDMLGRRGFEQYDVPL